MYQTVTKEQVKPLVGKTVYAIKKDGSYVTGKLIRVKGDQLVFQHDKSKGKVKTKAILPLALFDLLAIGTAPFAFGGFGGFGPFGFGTPFGFGGFPGPFI